MTSRKISLGLVAALDLVKILTNIWPQVVPRVGHIEEALVLRPAEAVDGPQAITP